MASLRQIRGRMRSIKNIHEITKAMEMIAGFRFKKAESRFKRAKPYLLEMENLLSNLAGALGESKPALFEERKIQKKALLLVTGDKGLCGAYNSGLIKAAQQWVAANSNFETFLIPAGKTGYEFFRRRQMPFLTFYPEKAMVDFGFAKKITEELKGFFLNGAVDSVEILYTTFRIGGVGQCRPVPFLSLAHLAAKHKDQAAIEYIYEPDFESVFSSLLSRYLEGKVYLALLESLSSEYQARMIAMKQATENGGEVLDGLTLLRNKTRQASITRELSEIVSGASILV